MAKYAKFLSKKDGVEIPTTNVNGLRIHTIKNNCCKGIHRIHYTDDSRDSVDNKFMLSDDTARQQLPKDCDWSKTKYVC